MSVFYYEPFYDIDRFLSEAFSPRASESTQRRIGEGSSNDAPRALKPRYVALLFAFAYTKFMTDSSSAGWTSTKTPKRTS